MGLFDGIKARIIKKSIKKLRKPSPIEKSVDEMLAEEMKTMTATNRTIDKLLKVKIMRQETNHTLDKIRDLNDEFDDSDEEEDDSEAGFEAELKKMLMGKILGSPQPNPSAVSSPSETGGGEGDNQTPTTNPIFDAIANATPEEIKKAKKKFLG